MHLLGSFATFATSFFIEVALIFKGIAWSLVFVFSFSF